MTMGMQNVSSIIQVPVTRVSNVWRDNRVRVRYISRFSNKLFRTCVLSKKEPIELRRGGTYRHYATFCFLDPFDYQDPPTLHSSNCSTIHIGEISSSFDFSALLQFCFSYIAMKCNIFILGVDQPGKFDQIVKFFFTDIRTDRTSLPNVAHMVQVERGEIYPGPAGISAS